MFSNVYLAMTAGEMGEHPVQKVAYMACHFSPYSKGLSNLPQFLPEGSILLLDDSMPLQGHDEEVVVGQLQKLVDNYSICGLLLDFQRKWTKESDHIVSAILQNTTCSTAVPPCYAKGRDCPVFLPPPPVNKPLAAYLHPWLKRGVFLEIAPETVQVTVTKEGSSSLSAPYTEGLSLVDEKLHCHYRVNVFPEKAVFTLSRTRADLANLTKEAYDAGVHGVLGLYQELMPIKSPHR